MKEEVTLKIEGMSSPCCAEEIKGDLLKIEGVKKASTYFADKIIKVEIDTEKATKEQLIAAVKEAGYEAVVTEGKEKIKFERQLKDLAEKYSISFQVLQDHWNFVKEASATVFADCCKWCHAHRITEMADAEAFCKSAIAEGMGEPETADQLFKIKKKVQALTDKEIKEMEAEHYGTLAEKYALKGNPCPIRREFNKTIYTAKELASLPEIARNLALGCGNPVSFADLKPEEVEVDLGCGAGIDVILAADKIREKGKIIGVDIAPQMIEWAKKAVAQANLGNRNIEFSVDDLEKLKLSDSIADTVISNCVIVLCPNKDLVYGNAFRILKPGGRLAISDVVLTEPIDPKINERFKSTWRGILGGAIPEKDYLEIVKNAGFKDIEVVKRHIFTPEEVFMMSQCPGPEFVSATDPEDLKVLEGKAASVKFIAVKPQP
ncbi:MAG: methyltransferase domain-containing protein [Nanoarchaeota archaeon]|nr:methyltransferase domain-containing protein [Nanoarchaeota archaeon]MBU1320953.1 methyltransferase domain-containing protein [Nanoarchaeota archaeon]MBU1598338.1 methyltransferase domain-containing protein [Nanoarchaeota archaeon]MBU2442125.1 methyltransferase domain-containing protein [Nanoarchaeota archaeon]